MNTTTINDMKETDKIEIPKDKAVFTQTQWVEFEHQFPPQFEPILVAYEDAPGCKGWTIRVATWSYIQGLKIMTFGGSEAPREPFTHWCKIPELPNE